MGVNRAGSGAAAKRSRLPSRIVNEAARWALRFSSDDDISVEERGLFEDWLRADPRHAAEFDAQVMIWELVRDIPADVRARWLERVQTQERWHAKPLARWVWAGTAAMAASMVLLVIAWLSGWLSSAPATEYATRTAETRTIRFTDGSLAILNTRTRLQWVGAPPERRVRLHEGEAFFRVAHDALRPFRVIVDQATIEAVGTQFDVYRKADGRVRVIVLEGAVHVTPSGAGGGHPIWERRIEAHQQIEYQSSRIVDDVRRASDEDLLWRQGTVRFQKQPLGQAIEELQRYTDRHILIDPGLALVPVGGVYSTRNISADLTRIARFVPMVVQEHDDTIMLAHRQAETPDEH